MHRPLVVAGAASVYNDYPVYPEDDGYDTPKNPYSPA